MHKGIVDRFHLQGIMSIQEKDYIVGCTNMHLKLVYNRAQVTHIYIPIF